jgi:hypothetical protein
MSSELPHVVIVAIDGLQRAYAGACSDLELGTDRGDVPKRERLANTLVRLFQDGERNVEVLRRRAVMYLKNSKSMSA